MMLTDVARQATKRKRDRTGDPSVFQVQIRTWAWVLGASFGLLAWGWAGVGFSLEETADGQNQIVMDRKLAQSLPVGESSRATLRRNDRGSEVRELQAALRLLGYFGNQVDGVFGSETDAAVRRFQQAAGIEVDGVVGPATWGKLFPAAPTPIATNNPTPQANASRPNQATSPPKPSSDTQPTTIELPVLRMGMRGPAIQRLQERLQAKGFLKGSADGVFGQETKSAVQDLQRTHKLEPDGVVGPATWRILFQ